MPPHTLSKSSFLKFEQCPKAFYFYKSLPYLRDKLSKDKELTFRRGHEVGYFAQQLFPGGIDVSLMASGAEAALMLTHQLIENRQEVIYEATFMFNEVLVMVDILRLWEGKYIAYEVKSALRVSEVFLRDACLQYYVLSQCLPGFDDMFLVTINGDYLKNGEVDCRKLFKKRSVKKQAEENFSYFDFQVKAALLVLEQNKIPNIPVGPQCFRPYQCDFFETCWKEELSEKSVFFMPFTNKEIQFEWHRAGLKLIDQVPDEILQKESLLRIKNSFVLGEPYIDLAAIARFVSNVKEPVVAMDMEIWNPAIPELDNTRPFEQIPFLAGFYNEEKSSHYFASHSTDQRENFALALLELSAPYATVLVYDKNLELSVIGKLSELFPHLKKRLDELRNRIVDVFDVFLKMHYYHPAFKNSFSLKVTSAALLGDMNYGSIGSGLEAMSFFTDYRSSGEQSVKEELKQKLVHYCVTDSAATLRLFRFLERILKEKTPGD